MTTAYGKGYAEYATANPEEIAMMDKSGPGVPFDEVAAYVAQHPGATWDEFHEWLTARQR